jgi:hypothetical protein
MEAISYDCHDGNHGDCDGYAGEIMPFVPIICQCDCHPTKPDTYEELLWPSGLKQAPTGQEP